MRFLQPGTLIAIAFSIAACGGGWGKVTRKEIEGNNTGGIIPAEMLQAGGNPQALADAHCAKWKSAARITYGAGLPNTDVVFVCEIGGVPAVMAPSAPQPAPSQIPAPASAPAKR